MINKKHIKQIEKLLNKEKIINYELLQISFDIVCLKFETLNSKKFIAKFYNNKNNYFNAVKAEAENLLYLNKIMSSKSEARRAIKSNGLKIDNKIAIE